MQITNQLFNAGGEGEAASRQQTHPGGATLERQRREFQIAELRQPPENRARRAQAVNVLDDEDRQHAEAVHQLFNASARFEENLEREGTLAKARADEITQRIADHPARRADQQSFLESK